MALLKVKMPIKGNKSYWERLISISVNGPSQNMKNIKTLAVQHNNTLS